jgi:rod shape-determining protein MreD
LTSLLLVLAAFFFDAALRTFLTLGLWSPDLLLLAVLYLTLRRPLGEAYVLAFFAGLAWDLLLMDPLGMHAFLFVLAAMFTAKLKTLLWARYAIARFVIGFLVCSLVRFGEVIFWLSDHGYDDPVLIAQQYILYGALVTGACFAMAPWRTKPIQLSKPSPHILFSERYS